MNFFPNLQIHVYSSENESTSNNRSRRARTSYVQTPAPPVSTTTSNIGTNTIAPATATSMLQSVFQNLMRRGNGESPEIEDVQIYFGYEPIPMSTGLQMHELNRYTQLFVYEEDAENMCSICRNNFACQDICRKIVECNHYFHQACVDSWLIRNHTCPMCRNPIISSLRNQN
jgi:hypothetical protein